MATPRSTLETPLTTWLKVGNDCPPGVLLESVEGGETIGRWSVVASDPLWKVIIRGNELIRSWRNGKQEIFQLCAPDRREKLYIRAFLEMFESDYAPHVGEVERLAGKKVRKLYVTLPHNYHD